MLDTQGRFALRKDLLEEVPYLQVKTKYNVFYHEHIAEGGHLERRLLIMPQNIKEVKGMYFVGTYVVDEGTRIPIPKSIKDAFPNATYLAAVRDNKMYILIIEHAVKHEEE